MLEAATTDTTGIFRRFPSQKASQRGGVVAIKSIMTSVVVAKALYNNDSEADDELSFKKGDVVSVLETDYEGMEGWWLCSLGDKQGVAPGNRLQLISYGEVETADPNEIYDSPGNAFKEKYGDYDVPKPHKDLSPPEFQDYAIPKSPYGGIPLPESQRHGFVMSSPRLSTSSNVRDSNSSDGLISNEVYDAPSRWSSERSSAEYRSSGEVYQGSGPEEIYDVPSRNSMESDDGAQGNIALRVPDIPPKASNIGYHDNNSDLQDGQDIYDSPATALGITDYPTRTSEDLSEIYDELPLSNDSKKLSVLLQSLSADDCNNIYQTIPDEIYDVPPAMSDDGNPTIPDGNPTVPDDIYEVPPGELTRTCLVESRDFADGNNNPPSPDYCDNEKRSSQAIPDECFYDVPQEAGGVYDNFDMNELEEEMRMEEMKRKLVNEKSVHKNKKSESESDDYVDYQEIYGMGKEEPREVKKVGEQVNNENSVLERINMEKVRELRITRSVALINLDKLQQAVDVAVTKLLSFVTEDWRQPDVLALNINSIRDISGKVKVALRLLTEFGLGSLVNCQKLNDREIFRKIKEALEPLLHTYYSIKSMIQRLDETNWNSAYQMRDDDELNSITKMAEGIPCDAYNLGAVISNISSLLFDKTNEQSHPASRYDIKETKTHPQVPLQRYSPPASARKGGLKGLELKKVESEPVGIGMKMLVTSKPPPKISAKPKRGEKAEGKSGASGEPFPKTVSELTNNLLNQIEDMKTPSPGLRRKESKRLSPKTVRRLCSIGLKDDDRNEKIFEDVASVPAKPSRLCSSSTESESMNTRPAMVVGENSSKGAEKSLPSSSSSLVSVNNRAFQETRRENGDIKNVQCLESFVEKMDTQVVILKEGIKNFRESVRECEIPKVFVAHSKFIVLSAHKLVYIGDGASRSLVEGYTQKRISQVTNTLSETINDFVENIKIAARQFPNENAMNSMIKSAAKVTEKALELYKTLKDHGES